MIRRPPRSTLFPTRRSSDLSLGDGCSKNVVDGIDNRLRRLLVQSGPEWQAHQPITNGGRDVETPVSAAELAPRGGIMQRYVVKERSDPPLLQAGDETRPGCEVR